MHRRRRAPGIPLAGSVAILLGFLLKKLTCRLGQAPWFVNEMAVDVGSLSMRTAFTWVDLEMCPAFGRDR
ncbi:MAG: hypothetical protein Ct9H300mP7_3870 [Verrucomicrobiota bacterium]|nr:MAG: hypothetical protein Ct9H300mP7_3870 [Verrucomicrobiota bacterium]